MQKRYTWKRDGVTYLGVVAAITAWQAYDDYRQKGFFDPQHYMGMAIILAVSVLVTAGVLWLMNNFE